MALKMPTHNNQIKKESGLRPAPINKGVMSTMQTKCPHCKSHTLGFWERSALNNFHPTTCPKCSQQYVVSTGLALLWFGLYLLSVLLYLLLIDNDLELSLSEVIIFLCIGTFSRSLFAKTIKYGDFHPYTKRPIWKNAGIFGAVPIAIVAVVIYFLARTTENG